MPLQATSINYRFSQSFHVPADRAFKWCTDYGPSDHELMHESGKRRITKLSEDAIILTDTFAGDEGKKMTKTKLVRLNPRDLSWTSTHISGPIKHSQYLYRIIPEGEDGSRLEFVGFQLEPRNMTKSEAAALMRKIRKEDSTAWKHLAQALEKDLT